MGDIGFFALWVAGAAWLAANTRRRRRNTSQ
jgi:hypothetical protein